MVDKVIVMGVDINKAKQNVNIGTIGHLDHNKTTLEEAINAYLNKATEEAKKQEVKPYGRTRKRVN